MGAPSSKEPPAGSDEQSDLVSKSRSAVIEGTRADYGTHLAISTDEEKGATRTYDIEELSTWRVFRVFNGTVLQCVALWKETGAMAILYWASYFTLYANREKGFSEVVGKESSIRAFIAMFSTLIGLLLSFYTALNLGRWWQMRMAVENIQEGSKTLTMLVSQVTRDELFLRTIHRYARASLFFIFAASKDKSGAINPRIEALKLGLLTEDEAAKLELLNPHMSFVQAETLWVWLANAVTKLHQQGLTKGPPHYCQLMAAVDQGRSGVPAIQAYLETPIPLGYVHLLCLMVKLHNILLTILMAMTSVMLSGGEKGFQAVGVFRTGFRAFFMPFLYNAILILNMEVCDPFGDDAMDFDFNLYDKNMMVSAQSYSHAAENCPDWLVNRTFQPANAPKESTSTP